MKKKNWSHETKFKNKVFFGFYTYTNGERIFNLKQVGGERVITFESHQQCKAMGFILK